MRETKLRVLKEPCNDCPFRKKSTRSWIGQHTVEELHMIAVSEQFHTCHQTHNVGERAHCQGRIAYAKKNAKLFRNKELQAIADNSQTDPDTILSAWEFFEHHNFEKSV